MMQAVEKSGGGSPRVGIQGVKLHIGFAAMTALLLALAYPAPGWYLLIWIALTPITLLAMRAQWYRRLAWTTYLVGFLWYVLMIRWLSPVTVGGWLLFAAYLALYWPAYAVLMKWLHERWNWPAVVTLPLAWVSLEFVRCNYLQHGFNWFALAHALAPYKPSQSATHFGQFADVFGQHGVSLIIAMTNGAWVDLLTRPWSRPGKAGGPPRGSWSLRGSLIVWLFVMMGSWVYGSIRLREAGDAAMPGIRVAVVQTNVPQDNKQSPDPAQRQADWRQLQALVSQAAALRPDVIVWPETMAPAPLTAEALSFARDYLSVDDDGELASWLRVDRIAAGMARGAQADLLAGAPGYIERLRMEHDGQVSEAPDGRTNSVIHYRPDGRRGAGEYHKMQRVPFGEYVPWVEHWPWAHRLFIRYLTPYDRDYSLRVGSGPVVFELTAYDRVADAAGGLSDLPAVDALSGDAAGPGMDEKDSDDAAGGGSAVTLSDDGLAGMRPETSANVDATGDASSQATEAERDLDAIPDPDPLPAAFDSAKGESRGKPRMVRAVTPICFEDSSSPLVRRMVFDGDGKRRADVLINLTNDGWFEGTYQPHQQMQLATYRSIETRTPMARAVNTGISGFIDSSGRVVSIVHRGDAMVSVEGVAAADLTMDRRRPAFAVLGDLPMKLILTFTVGLAAIGGLRRARQPRKPRHVA